MLEASQSEPLVVSAFLRLPRSSVKHAYAFHYTAFQRVLDVPTPYMLFCSQPDCSQLNRTRTAQGHTTEIRQWNLDAALQLLATRLQLNAALIDPIGPSTPSTDDDRHDSSGTPPARTRARQSPPNHVSRAPSLRLLVRARAASARRAAEAQRLRADHFIPHHRAAHCAKPSHIL